MRVHNALWLSGRPRREKDKRIVVHREPSSLGDKGWLLLELLLVPGGEQPHSDCGERCGQTPIGLALPDGEARLRGASQDFNFERCQAAIDWNRTASELPNRQKVDEKLEGIAMVEKDTVRPCQSQFSVPLHAAKHYREPPKGPSSRPFSGSFSEPTVRSKNMQSPGVRTRPANRSRIHSCVAVCLRIPRRAQRNPWTSRTEVY